MMRATQLGEEAKSYAFFQHLNKVGNVSDMGK